MRESYIGLADRSGLKLLVPERDHTSRFLTRRAARENAICFWVVIDSSHQHCIRAELLAGERHNALHLLELLAVDFGVSLSTDLIPAHAIVNT